MIKESGYGEHGALEFRGILVSKEAYCECTGLG